MLPVNEINLFFHVLNLSENNNIYLNLHQIQLLANEAFETYHAQIKTQASQDEAVSIMEESLLNTLHL